MQDLQEIFNRVQENKKKLKDLKDAYREALKGSESYIEVEESLKTLREKKKSIETELKSQFSSEFVQMDDIKIDIASDQEMINDIAMTMVMKGETVSVNDKYENEYEPLFSVKFKKVS
ncbi:MAG: hypothetical protein CO030_04010 [Candidatus Magasanikbacteria bacterium CG_4_9_14_0_2_um_filter_42_11]|uniref:Uncharacterized protein n=1 Tax=Candidatus Magasanikbacteria bacterium CG_4_9_14_0_2_um_filter_42_11 TaxID=1974643 RepID=A0A2M8F963_9BACT|nr:MAG: hypothetical protein COU34_04225 [Candidatus Magasanikbacteria bacterium CG10_big_fil_rev_8_21_14_0_10_43_9]PIY92241.1 MAG: hypothetical protein COY70_04290 [Candidatus Magasanikbacteria bacterium CG_4_10_14_0_8_um_filter_42_12]PJC52256.1 MAG: hypothetical protein CO030_04010 [Candidatus Magasanikbacteria bacterium CG_4_9_14_0_2_um_filter_42_11]